MAEELSQVVQSELGWDTDMVTQVIEQIVEEARNGRHDAANDIIQNYLTGSSVCQAAARSFLERQVVIPATAVSRKLKNSSANKQLNQGTSGLEVRAVYDDRSGSSRNKTYKRGSSGQRSSEYQSQAHRQQLPVKYAAGKASSNTANNRHAAQQFARQAFNCLQCVQQGIYLLFEFDKLFQVYNFTESTVGALALIRNNGACTFCKEPLPEAAAAAANATNTNCSTHNSSAVSEHSDGVGPSASASRDLEAPGSSTAQKQVSRVESAIAQADEDAKRARAFAKKLVEFDHTAAQRTTVLDEQGDYFEIETNMWLDPEERAANRTRQAIQEQLQKQNKVSVTIDLLGREVRQVERTRLDDQLTFVVDELRRKAVIAADAARETVPEGGGTGIAAAEAVAQIPSEAVRAQLPVTSGSDEGGVDKSNKACGFVMRPNIPEGETAPTFVVQDDAQNETKGHKSRTGGQHARHRTHNSDRKRQMLRVAQGTEHLPGQVHAS